MNNKTMNIISNEENSYKWITQELKSYLYHPEKYKNSGNNKEQRFSVKELSIWYMKSLVERKFSLEEIAFEMKEIFNVMSSKAGVDLLEDVEWFGCGCEKYSLEDFFKGIYVAIYRELINDLQLYSDSSWLGHFISLNLDNQMIKDKKYFEEKEEINVKILFHSKKYYEYLEDYSGFLKFITFVRECMAKEINELLSLIVETIMTEDPLKSEQQGEKNVKNYFFLTYLSLLIGLQR